MRLKNLYEKGVAREYVKKEKNKKTADEKRYKSKPVLRLID